MQNLCLTDIWYANETFETTPRLFSQVYIILAKKFDAVILVVFALLSNSQRLTYAKMFEMLKDDKPTLNPTANICDFEYADFKAMKEAFLGVEIKGCFFLLSTKYAQDDSCQVQQPHYLFSKSQDDI